MINLLIITAASALIYYEVPECDLSLCSVFEHSILTSKIDRDAYLKKIRLENMSFETYNEPKKEVKNLCFISTPQMSTYIGILDFDAFELIAYMKRKPIIQSFNLILESEASTTRER